MLFERRWGVLDSTAVLLRAPCPCRPTWAGWWPGW